MRAFYSIVLLLALALLLGRVSAGYPQPPQIGVTMEQVKAQYSQPDRVDTGNDGTTSWVYLYGKGKRWIPWYRLAAHITVLTINFDLKGRVANYKTGRQPALR